MAGGPSGIIFTTDFYDKPLHNTKVVGLLQLAIYLLYYTDGGSLLVGGLNYCRAG